MGLTLMSVWRGNESVRKLPDWKQKYILKKAISYLRAMLAISLYSTALGFLMSDMTHKLCTGTVPIYTMEDNDT